MKTIKFPKYTLINERSILNSKSILKESCDGLTKNQRIVVEGIYNELRPLIEASLSRQQISGIFKQLEQEAIAGGNNRSLAGKGVDTAKKVNSIIDKVGGWMQDTTPVKAFDQKFEQLKLNIGQKFPELEKNLSGIGAWAKTNPGKTAAIIGVLTAIAALAGGPIGGAIAGQILRGSSELLKGNKLSTAVGKGAKSAAIGAIAGVVGDGIKNAAEAMFPAEVTQVFINQDGVVDISQLNAIKGVPIDQLSSEDIKQLIQTRSAVEGMMPRLNAEERGILQQQFDAINNKVNELGNGASVTDSVNNLQAQYGITGRGVDVVSSSTTDIEGSDFQGSYTDVEVDATYSADQLEQQMGIDSSEMPRNGWLDNNKQALMSKAGLSEDEFEDLQKATQLNRAISRAETIQGISISANKESKYFMGGEPAVLGIIDNSLTLGEEFSAEISTNVIGSSGPWKSTVIYQITGHDTNGNPVFEMTSVQVAPEVFSDKMFAPLDKLTELDPTDPLIKEFTSKVIMDTQSADMKTIVDTVKQNIATKIMQGASAVALGSALASAEVNSAKKSNQRENSYLQTKPLSEGQVYMVFNKVLTEAGFLKGVAGAAAKGAQWVGKQATEKATSAKIAAAWKLEGSPTDSEALKQFLLNYGGIDASMIDKVYNDLSVGSPAVIVDSVKQMIAKLPADRRVRLHTYVKKHLGIA
jgi:hypothetical protein